MTTHDLTGKQFGKWTVVTKSGQYNRPDGKSGDTQWLCKCACGRESKVNATYLRHGKSKQCLYCHKHNKKYYDTNNIPRQFWLQIVRNANKRNIKINISSEYAYKIFKQQNKMCALSGKLISLPRCATEWELATASLDRINNNLGYEVGNIQWLHKDVNKMKGIHLQEYFIGICNEICNHNKPRSNSYL